MLKKYLGNIWPTAKQARINRIFLLGGIGALIAAVTYTSHKAALANQYVADSLADNYMFFGVNGLDQLAVPGTHTYLLKWPVFLLNNAVGFNLQTYVAVSVGLALITYLGFLFFVYKVAPSIRIVGMTALALALIVLMTKPYPTDDSFSLVGLAMPTIRNIEYLIYFAYVACLIRIDTLGKRFWWSASLFAVLAASDPFFLYLGGGSTVLLLLARWIRGKRIVWSVPEAFMALNVILGAIGAQILLKALHFTGVATLSTNKISPHPFVQSVQDLWNAVLGAFQGTLINFGGDFFGMPMGGKTLPVLVNASVALLAAGVAIHLLRRIRTQKALFATRTSAEQQRLRFVYLSIFSAIIAYLALILSSHDGVEYVGGIRYIYITVFVGLLVVAYKAYEHSLQDQTNLFWLIAIGFVLLLFSGLSLAKQQQMHGIDIQNRNFGDRQHKVLQILRDNNVKLVSGDFWSIYPIKFIGENKFKDYQLQAVPIEKCADAKPYFVNKEWYKPGSNKHLTTALYVERDTLDAEIFHGCSVEDYHKTYGEPAETIPVRIDKDGNVLDMVMVYDYDIRTQFNTAPLQ